MSYILVLDTHIVFTRYIAVSYGGHVMVL